ncbi:preprotein translocase subunit SecY [Candidatus Marinamargulisbacteria bacterium SCGC AAA071-K20]|nr:preprotein translocase subunit SecY [Candidatus Marinamargulisbacteria bacterium SCGC AAA071-K20]
MNSLSVIFTIPSLRSKIFYSIIVLVIYRLGSHIPISGVDLEALSSLFNQGGVLGFFNLFSGGGLSRFSIFALGILPFINASIIMQLMTIIWPKLKELAEEGDSGRKQLAQYTRYLSIILAFVQASVMTIGFKSFILPGTSFSFFFFYSVIGLVAGASLVMWLGELITENGLGNGASLLIFVGIIAQMPFYIKNTYVLVQGGTSIIGVIILAIVFLGIIVSIVFVQEAEKKIPVQYAKRVVGRKMYGGQNTYIPLRLIQGGVMPIIFASAVLQFPLMFGQYISIEPIQNFFNSYYTYDGLIYNLLFCLLIFFFTYFYTAITFNPQDLADNIKKQGGFIMGVRPGKPTVDFLEKIITKLTLVGAFFLSFVALVPVIAANVTNVTSFMGLGGTALLIIVGVAMDVVKQIEVFIISKKYEGLME